jgi:hypothetical protein
MAMLKSRSREEQPSAPAPRASEQCDALERQLADTHAALDIETEKLDKCGAVEELAKVRGQIDFLEIRSKALIEERFTLEPARLADLQAEAAEKSAKASAHMGAVSREFDELDRRARQLEGDIPAARLAAQEAMRAKVALDTAVKSFGSGNAMDRQQLQTRLAQLHGRLVGLGR